MTWRQTGQWRAAWAEAGDKGGDFCQRCQGLLFALISQGQGSCPLFSTVPSGPFTVARSVWPVALCDSCFEGELPVGFRQWLWYLHLSLV